MAYSQEDTATKRLDNWWLHRKNADGRHVQLMDTSRAPDDSLEAQVGAFEKGLIVEALEHTHGNQTKAAGLLGTTKRVIQYKVKKYRIDFAKYRRL